MYTRIRKTKTFDIITREIKLCFAYTQISALLFANGCSYFWWFAIYIHHDVKVQDLRACEFNFFTKFNYLILYLHMTTPQSFWQLSSNNFEKFWKFAVKILRQLYEFYF